MKIQEKLRLVFLQIVMGAFLMLTYSFHMHVKNILLLLTHSHWRLITLLGVPCLLPVTIVLLPDCSSHLCTVG